MKRFRVRIAAAVTAVVLAACAGMSSYAAAEGEKPILYDVRTAAEGENYLELKDASAPEQEKESGSDEKAAAAEKGEEPGNAEPSPEADAENKADEQAKSGEGNDPEAEKTPEAEETPKEGETPEAEKTPEAEGAPEGDTKEGESGEPEAQPEAATANKQVLIIAIPADGSYEKYNPIKLTVNFHVASNPVKTAEINLSDHTPGNTEDGQYYIFRYDLGTQPFDSITAEGLTVVDQAGEGSTNNERSGELTTVKLPVERGSVKELTAEEIVAEGNTSEGGTSGDKTTEEETVEEESPEENKFPWAIVIAGVVLAAVAAGGAVFYFLRSRNKQEKSVHSEPAIQFSPYSELRVMLEKNNGQCDHYRFEFNGKSISRLSDLENKKDGSKMTFIRNTDLSNVVVQAYGKELAFIRQADGREENLFVLDQVHSVTEIGIGEGRILRFVWIPGIMEDP